MEGVAELKKKRMSVIARTLPISMQNQDIN